MCDYSLHRVASRPAVVGDELTVSTFHGSFTRGLAGADPSVAVCLRPGTEIAFADNIRSVTPGIGTAAYPHRTARFRKVNEEQATAHHDAVELPDGTVLILSSLATGQRVTVLQLPAPGREMTFS
jgi:hypothetical protein